MKRTTIHISAALALLLGFTACTQDEAGFLPEGAEGTPIVFTATGLNPAATATAGTRAPADGNWKGVQSVAVLMDGTVKTYNVTPSTVDLTSATLTSTDPYYWTNHNDITVTAWWPYTAGETTPPAVKVKANQSTQKDFEGSDLIVADGQTVTYGSPTLRFTHRTARVTIVLTDYTEGLASVQLTGLSTENDNPDKITPYDKGSNTYIALVAPQSVEAGTTFITCTFTNGKVFVYKMKNATDWQAGGEYTYTVSLAAAKDPGYTIEGNGSYTVTSADGLMNVAELVNGGKTDINITLDKNIDLTGKEWTPIGTESQSYTGTFDGGNHTITGLTINQSATSNVGLFASIAEGGTVKNLTLKDVNITADSNAGAIAGENRGTIENCSVSGSVTSSSNNSYVGGITGWNYRGTITDCHSSATVEGKAYVGGIAGQSDATITACYSTGSVTATKNNTTGYSFAGGVVGYNNGAVLIACYATGSVSGGGDFVGGVVGSNENGTLTACYHATGKVSGASGSTGGVVGRNLQNIGFTTIVTACYWGDNGQEQGIGYNQAGTGETTMVTDGDWQNAVTQMNAALQSAGSEWRYELTGALPTLKKQ